MTSTAPHDDTAAMVPGGVPLGWVARATGEPVGRRGDEVSVGGGVEAGGSDVGSGVGTSVDVAELKAAC
jgi:hypothetical protein